MLAYGMGVILLVLALGVFAMATGWAWPYAVLVQGLDWLKYNGWESTAIGALLLILGLLLFIRPRPAVEVSFALTGKFGEVRITGEAIQEIVGRAALTVEGVRKVLVNLRHREEGLEITVISQFNPETVIPEISAELQAKVKQDVEHYTGIRVAEVKVLVRSGEAPKPARVR